MALLAPNEGEGLLLAYMLNKTNGSYKAQNNAIMHLFTNDYTPVETSTKASFTEASDGSYSSVTLTGDSWSISEGAPTEASYAQQTFSFAGASTVYGYYVTDDSDSTVLWAERFSSAGSTGSSGGTIYVTPKITLD
jgi:iron uptake system EfeUOB component EfeO/EfeM